jgi:DNA repair protein SbcD/Mre11
MSDDPSTFSFVHAADLHLDTPFSGVGQIAPRVASALRDASLHALERIVELAIARKVAFVLIAGDLYDGAERGLRAQLKLRNALGRLAEEGIETFIVHGNHDPLEQGWSAISRWPDEVHVFGTEVGCVPVRRRGEVIATVQGISYARRDTTENLARRFSRPDGPGLHIGLLHCNVEQLSNGHANYAPCTLADLESTHLDYLALGHVHDRRVLRRGAGPGDPWVVYPGNTQARSPRPSELGAKGVLVVEVEASRVAEVEFVACDEVRFTELEVDIAPLSDLGELESELREREAALLDDAEGRSLIVRARLVGRGELHEDLVRPGVTGALLDQLRAELAPAGRFCWWDELTDDTSRLHSRAEIAARGDLSSDLLHLADALDEESRRTWCAQLIEEAPRALQRRLGELAADPSSADLRLDDAIEIALDQLGGSQ